MGQAWLHRIAATLLGALVSLLPEHRQEWGHALRAELDFIEGGWAALGWALGSIGFFFHPREIFAEGGLMRRLKVVLPSLAAAVIVALLLTPTLRQAMSLVFLGQWRHHDVAEVEHVASEARANHDAEMLAWAAQHSPDDGQARKYADEAVAIDPNLTWLYYQFAGPRTYALDRSYGHKLADRLIAWDPDNAAPYLLKASLILGSVKDVLHPWEAADPELRKAAEPYLRKALQARTFDRYQRRSMELARTLARRRGDEPFEVPFSGLENMGWGSWALYSSYTDSLIDACTASSPGNCWQVARLGQVMRLTPDSHSFDRVWGARIQAKAYARLLEVNAVSDPAQRDILRNSIAESAAMRNPMRSPEEYMQRRLLNVQVGFVEWSTVVFAFCGIALFVLVALCVFRRGPAIGGLHGGLLGAMSVSALIAYVSFRPLAVVSEFLHSNEAVTDYGLFFRLTPFFNLRGTIEYSLACGYLGTSLCIALMAAGGGIIAWMVWRDRHRQAKAASATTI